MDLDNLFRSVSDAITKHNDPNQPEYPQNNLLSFVQNLFQQHGSRGGADPYGDPAGGSGGRGVIPASRDPYGDPGAGGSNVRPASEDPYGDPADQK